MTIKVFVGCAANHEDIESQAVLEYTLRKHASEDVEITWMKLSANPESFFYSNPKLNIGWNSRQWATPFSGFRWSIPAQCNFQGKAIYMDSDFIVKADIAELWNQEFEPGKMIMSKGGEHLWRFCCSLWNCEVAKHHVLSLSTLRTDPSSFKQMHQYMKRNRNLMQQFRGNWNCLDGEKYADLNNPEVKAIHYTSMPHQPQLKHALPRLKAEGRAHWFKGTVRPHWRADLQKMFDDLLQEAIESGYTLDRYTQEPTFGGYIKKDTHQRGAGVPSWGKT